MTKMIPASLAADLAVAYADAMELTAQRSAFLPDNPQAKLDRYLSLCDRTGVRLHNEHWVKYAQRAVDEIKKKRAAAFRAVFGPKAA